jgi:nucleoside-diphosphate-sugar epimerase
MEHWLPAMIEKETVFITGGAGFIGTTLARRLRDANRVVLFDNMHRDAVSGTDLLDHPNVSLENGDVRDAAALGEACRGATMFVHMASIAGVDTVMQKPVATMEVALEGTMNALRAARGLEGLKRFVDFSTSEVFGQYAFRAQEGDVTSLGAVGEARWTYAVSKLATEHLTHTYHKQYGLPGLSVRPFNVYGPAQVGEGAIHVFIRRALLGEPLEIHNEGDQIRSWCYIDDLVDGLLLCLEKEEACGNTFNLGNPRSTVTIYQLAQMVVSLSGSSSEIKHVEWSFPDVELRIPDIGKARNLLGFRPRVELEDGLMRTIDWYRSME